jgi:hypothetical protein
MPWNLYCVSVHENPRCDSAARRLSLRPAKSSGSVTLEGSRLSRSPCRLNASGYSRILVASVQIPGFPAGGWTPRIDPDASITRSNRTVCKGATKMVALEDAVASLTSRGSRYRP